MIIRHIHNSTISFFDPYSYSSFILKFPFIYKVSCISFPLFHVLPRVFRTPCVPSRHPTNWQIHLSLGIWDPVHPLPTSHRLMDPFIIVMPFNYPSFKFYIQRSTVPSRISFNKSMPFIQSVTYSRYSSNFIIQHLSNLNTQQTCPQNQLTDHINKDNLIFISTIRKMHKSNIHHVVNQRFIPINRTTSTSHHFSAYQYINRTYPLFHTSSYMI